MGFLGACASPSAMLGPAYTFSTTGNTLQTGFTYGSNKIITQYTGKTPLENLKDTNLIKEQNIKKKTLISEDFYILVKNKIEKNNNLFNKFNQ